MCHSPGLEGRDSRVPLLCPLKHGEVPLTVKPWSQKEKEARGSRNGGVTRGGAENRHPGKYECYIKRVALAGP